MSTQHEPKPRRRLGPISILICLVFAALFGVWNVGAVKIYRKAVQSEKWVRTTATVTELEVQSDYTKRRGTTYKIHCRYVYEVNGAEYVGSTIKISPFRNKVDYPSERVDWISERYPVGSKCDVWYNPADPSDAVLEPGIASWAPLEFAYCYAGVVTVGLLVLAAWGLTRKRGSSKLKP